MHKSALVFIEKLQKSPSAEGFSPDLLASGGWALCPQTLSRRAPANLLSPENSWLRH